MRRPEFASASEILAVRGLYDRAVALSRAGNQAQAASLCRQILERDSRNVSAMALLGQIALQAGQAGEALPWFQRLVKIQPKEAIFRRLLATAWLRLGRPDEAEAEALLAHRAAPKAPETLRLLFEISVALRKIDRALFFIEKALEIDPDNPERRRQYARVLELAGRTGEARDALRSLIASGRADGLACYALTGLETYEEEPPLRAEIERRIADPATPAQDRAHLHQAAARIDTALHRDDQAFAHFVDGARAMPRVRTADPTFADEVDRMRFSFTPAFFAERASWGNPSRRPVFVFGMPRSGTTLVEQILASHPRVYGAEELPFFADRITEFGRRDLTEADARQTARDYLKLLSAFSKSAERVVDKMPHNFERLWLLALLFPNASFIHCRRDPVANCVSCFTNPLGGKHFYASDLATLGAYYRSYHALMDHWRSVLPVTILDVDYETLVAEPEAGSRRMVEHIGLAWDDACLRFNETKRVVTTPSRQQVTRPIYTSSLDGWRRYEKHLGPLVAALGDLAAPTAR
jgi:Flp pilus assembly protein TadD